MGRGHPIGSFQKSRSQSTGDELQSPPISSFGGCRFEVPRRGCFALEVSKPDHSGPIYLHWGVSKMVQKGGEHVQHLPYTDGLAFVHHGAVRPIPLAGGVRPSWDAGRNPVRGETPAMNTFTNVRNTQCWGSGFWMKNSNWVGIGDREEEVRFRESTCIFVVFQRIFNLGRRRSLRRCSGEASRENVAPFDQ